MSQTPQAIASLVVRFDLSRLQPPENEHITLALPGGGKIAATLSDFRSQSENRFIWEGRIDEDTRGIVTLSVRDGALVGNIVLGDRRMFTIRYLKDDLAYLEELDPLKFPLEESEGTVDPEVRPARPPEVNIEGVAPPVRVEPGQIGVIESQGAQPLTDQSTPVDVMVLYTQGAIDSETSEAGVKSRIDQMVDQTNQSLKYSGVALVIRLADAVKTDYVEKADLVMDWNSLKNNSRLAQFSGMADRRSQSEADITVMLTKNAPPGESCGQATQMHDPPSTDLCNSAYAVVAINCATTQFSFAHELGHIMGADHNAEAIVSGPPFAFSRGFISASKKWRTIMAYPTADCALPDCKRILRWSSATRPYSELREPPDANSVTEPTGSDQANNAEALTLTAQTVAGFSDTCAAP